MTDADRLAEQLATAHWTTGIKARSDAYRRVAEAALSALAKQQASPEAQTSIVGWPDTDRKVVIVPDGVLIAIRNAGLTLLKTQYGYELRKLGPIEAQGTTPPQQAAPSQVAIDNVRYLLKGEMGFLTAVRYMRNAFGLTLAEAKRQVEAIRDSTP